MLNSPVFSCQRNNKLCLKEPGFVTVAQSNISFVIQDRDKIKPIAYLIWEMASLSTDTILNFIQKRK